MPRQLTPGVSGLGPCLHQHQDITVLLTLVVSVSLKQWLAADRHMISWIYATRTSSKAIQRWSVRPSTTRACHGPS